MHPAEHKNLQLFWPLAILTAAAFGLYASTFGDAWVYDDFPIIVNNPDIRSLHNFFADSYPGRPLRELTYLIDYALFGLKPAGWHIQSILWHGLNATLLFHLALRLGGSRAAAWTAALLFLAHPIEVEAVASPANRKEDLVLAFSLLSLHAYLSAFKAARHRIAWLCAAAALGLVAFLGKEIAIALPLVFLAYELACVPKEERLITRFPRILGAAFAAGATAFFIWYLQLGGRAFFLHESLGRLRRFDSTLNTASESTHIAMVLKSAAIMVSKLLLPLRLAADYAYPLPSSWADPWVIAGIAGLVVYGLALWLSIRRQPLVFLGLVWLGAFWLPTSNLWPFGYYAADRYLYAPSAGFCLALAVALTKVCRKPAILATAVALILSLTVILTWQQERVWRTPETLWTQAVRVSPTSSHALGFLGAVKMDQGNYMEAFQLDTRALAANPANPLAHYDLGQIYERAGNRELALQHYRRFLQINHPTYRREAQEVRRHLALTYGITAE